MYIKNCTCIILDIEWVRKVGYNYPTKRQGHVVMCASVFITRPIWYTLERITSDVFNLVSTHHPLING